MIGRLIVGSEFSAFVGVAGREKPTAGQVAGQFSTGLPQKNGGYRGCKTLSWWRQQSEEKENLPALSLPKRPVAPFAQLRASLPAVRLEARQVRDPKVVVCQVAAIIPTADISHVRGMWSSPDDPK